MSLDRIANIVTNLAEPPLGLAGFGVPLVAAIMTSGQDSAWDTTYGADVDVIEVTPANWRTTLTALGVTSSEDLWVGVSDLMGQVRKPQLALVARRATAVAQVNNVSIDTAEDGTYTITVNGNDYTFVASGNTATQIRDGLIAAVDADPDVDASTGAGDTLDITALVAGVPFTLSVSHSVTPANISTTSSTASVGLPEDITVFRSERNDWYFLLETTRTTGVILAAAAVIETDTKLLVAQTDDANIQTASTTDIASRLGPLGLNYSRTSLWYSDNDDQFVDFAIVGKMAPADPGSETWANQSLASVTGIVPTSEAALVAKNVNWLESFTAANFSMTQEGKVSSGTFIDLIRGRDWLNNLLQIRLVQALRDAPKIPYSDTGGETIAAIIRGALEDAADVGLIDASTIVITVPPASSQSSTDRGNRHFPNVTWSATLLGAIHTLEVTGSLAA